MKNKDVFLEELEARLAENRLLAEKSILPSQLHGLASYLAFNSFRTLMGTSLVLTLMLFAFFYEDLVRLSKVIFWYE